VESLIRSAQLLQNYIRQKKLMSGTVRLHPYATNTSMCNTTVTRHSYVCQWNVIRISTGF